MDSDLLRADPRLRRQTAIAVGVGAAVGIAVVALVAHHLRQPADFASPAANVQTLKRIVFFATVGISLCLLALAAYCARNGLRSLRQKQWPVAGTRVVRDTPVRRGEAAKRVAHGVLASAFGLLLLGLALPVCALFWLAAIR